VQGTWWSSKRRERCMSRTSLWSSKRSHEPHDVYEVSSWLRYPESIDAISAPPGLLTTLLPISLVKRSTAPDAISNTQPTRRAADVCALLAVAYLRSTCHLRPCPCCRSARSWGYSIGKVCDNASSKQRTRARSARIFLLGCKRSFAQALVLQLCEA
jgi:hypothetical protein